VKKKILHASVFTDPSEIVQHLVGLKDVRVLSYARRGPVGEITVEQVLTTAPSCPACGTRAWVKDRPVVSYVDLPFGGVPMTVRWRKHRLTCKERKCATRSFTLSDHRIAAKGCMLTTRAAKWVVKQIGAGETVAHLARELCCSWDVVNAAMRIYGAALLAADTKRLKETTAIGLDETLFVRKGPYKHKSWSTTVCDVANHQLIDVLPTRQFTEVAGWLKRQPHHMRENLDYGCLDMSRTYSAVFRVVTPKVTRVIDRFHVMRHAIAAVDDVRRRVQQQRLGHRGRAGDPLYPGPQAARHPRDLSRPRAAGTPRGSPGTRRPGRRGGLRLQRERGRRPLLRHRGPSTGSGPAARHHRPRLALVCTL
jgi:transposase